MLYAHAATYACSMRAPRSCESSCRAHRCARGPDPTGGERGGGLGLRVGRGCRAAAHEGVGQPAGVLDLADDLLALRPQAQRSPAAGVHHAVRGQLRHDQRQILEADGSHPPLPRFLEREVPGDRQGFGVEPDGRCPGRTQQRFVVAVEHLHRVVGPADRLMTRGDEQRVRGVGIGEDVVRQRPRVVRTEDGHVPAAERRVDQGLVLDTGGILHGRAAGPDRFPDDAHTAAAPGVGEGSQDGRDDAAGVPAGPGHVDEVHGLGRCSQRRRDQFQPRDGGSHRDGFRRRQSLQEEGHSPCHVLLVTAVEERGMDEGGALGRRRRHAAPPVFGGRGREVWDIRHRPARVSWAPGTKPAVGRLGRGGPPLRDLDTDNDLSVLPIRSTGATPGATIRRRTGVP